MRASLLLLLVPAVAYAGPFEPTPSGADQYGESFSFVADLEDGTYVQVQLSLTNIGPGSGHGLCRALVVPRDGASWTVNERYSSDEWRYAGNTLSVGPCTASEGPATCVKVPLDGASVELCYDGPPKPVRPPSPVIAVAGAEHRTEILHMFTGVKAVVQRKGAAAVTSRGGGYADHSRSEIDPPELAERWIRFRALTGSRRVLVLGREARDGSIGPLWIWREDAEPVRAEGFSLRRIGAVPQFAAVVEGTPALRITSSRLLYRHAPVEEMGMLGAVVKPFVGSPVTYTHRAFLEQEGAPPIPGILEVWVREDRKS